MPVSNRRTPRKVDVHPPISEWPSVIGLAAGAVVGYLSAESALATRPHLLHWLVALGGGAIGWAAGYGVAWVMSRHD